MIDPTKKSGAIPADNKKEPQQDSSRLKQEPTPKTIPIKPGFYLVATPIGNLRDITFRALDILSSVDLIICEDTRVTGKLMQAYGFKKKMQVYNDHATEGQREALIKGVQNGLSVAVLSDAGTPMVSDPGYKLIRLAIQNALYITSIPGPNAALPALQLSGMPTDQFSFLGFLPNKTAARKKALQNWAEVPSTLVLYETGPRLVDSLIDMKAVLGNRESAIIRELTKIYEESTRGTLSELIAHYRDTGAPKGEIVVVLGQATEEILSTDSIEEQLKKALKTLSVRDAAEVVAKATGKPKKTIYTLALKLSSSA
jgi:16S rRNA (cytidine1402-2'-O)-methyltransferase